MILQEQSRGLAQILKFDDGGGVDKFVFAALATTAVASPLAAISYRAKGPSLLGGLTTLAAAGLAYKGLPSSAFSARALSPPEVDAKGQPSPTSAAAGLDLKPVLRLFHPWTVLKLLAKNIGLQTLLRLNLYMYLQHEREALAAEQEGAVPPPAPELPDLTPGVLKGCSAFGREFAIAATRETYGCIARWRLGPSKAQPLLRNSKLWIRDVLALKHRSSSLGRRFVAYQFATLHAVALHVAADCTVSVVQHTVRSVRRRKEDGNRLVYWAKGVVLQVGRCVVLLFASSIGAALGSLVSPGRGTMLGQNAVEALTMIAVGHAIDILME